MAYISKALVFCTQLLLSYLSSVCISVDFRLTLTISLCRDWTAICKGAIILELRMFGFAPLLRSKRTLSIWFFFVAQCSGVFPEESITFNTGSKERKQKRTKTKAKPSNVLIALKKRRPQWRFRSVLLYFFQKGKEKISWDAVHCVKLIKYCAEYTVFVREMGNLSISCPLLYIFFSHLISLSPWLFFSIWLHSSFFRGCTK